MNTKILEFALKTDNVNEQHLTEYIALPQPARHYIPEWYKKASMYATGKPTANPPNNTIKACMPFLESYSNGYIFELWQDIVVTQTPEGPMINWNVGPEVVHFRDAVSGQGLPVPAGHHWQHFAWNSPLCIKTPPGYSFLLTHPFNRFDLPFTTLSGIADADEGIGNGNIPFFLKEGFEGVIPKGTPLYQILPYKRDDWKSKFSPKIVPVVARFKYESTRVLSGWYKRTLWKKKTWN